MQPPLDSKQKDVLSASHAVQLTKRIPRSFAGQRTAGRRCAEAGRLHRQTAAPFGRACGQGVTCSPENSVLKVAARPALSW